MSQTVLTTGANSGIGLEIALELARRGFRSVGSVRSQAKARAVAAAAEKAGVEVETVELDVTDAAGCERVIAELKPLGLINNAGYGAIGAIEDVSDADARQTLETMIIAPMRLARLALPHMRKKKAGRIVNISSILGRTTAPLSGWYQGCKHALEALSDALRAEVASAGIHVILVEPGGFKTNIWDDMEKAVAQHRGSRYAAAYRRQLETIRFSEPLMGDPTGVAAVVARAMTAWVPRARYLVGYDAHMIALTDRVLPTSVKDWAWRIALRL
jgi:NAD(P)-dependent dehydrogenase (short-subunit alcohol dehydrogenase family)